MWDGCCPNNLRHGGGLSREEKAAYCHGASRSIRDQKPGGQWNAWSRKSYDRHSEFIQRASHSKVLLVNFLAPESSKLSIPSNETNFDHIPEANGIPDLVIARAARSQQVPSEIDVPSSTMYMPGQLDENKALCTDHSQRLTEQELAVRNRALNVPANIIRKFTQSAYG